MLLKTFKSKNPVNFILIPLLAILFGTKNLLNPQKYPFYKGEINNLLYSPVAKSLENKVFLQTVIALLLIIILAFIIQQINNRFNFIRIRTMLPAPLFIILIAGFTGMHSLHPVYFGSIFVLLAIYRFFEAFDKVKPYSVAFDTGFLLGIASLFCFNLYILLPAFLIGIGILGREVRWREYTLILTGFLVPMIFALSYALITSRLYDLLHSFQSNTLTSNNHFITNIPLQIYLGYLILLTFAGTIKIIQQYDSKKVSTRKYFSFFFLFFLCSLFSFIFFPAASQEMLIVTAIPVTFLVSNFFVFLTSRFWGELMFDVLFISVVLLRFIV